MRFQYSNSTHHSFHPPPHPPNPRPPFQLFPLLTGLFSWRNNQEGSWFIQALCIVLENYGSQMELLHMLTHVSRIVAYELACCSDKELTDAMKQTPCIVSMLTRYVIFRPKKQDIR